MAMSKEDRELLVELRAAGLHDEADTLEAALREESRAPHAIVDPFADAFDAMFLRLFWLVERAERRLKPETLYFASPEVAREEAAAYHARNRAEYVERRHQFYSIFAGVIQTYEDEIVNNDGMLKRLGFRALSKADIYPDHFEEEVRFLTDEFWIAWIGYPSAGPFVSPEALRDEAVGRVFARLLEVASEKKSHPTGEDLGVAAMKLLKDVGRQDPPKPSAEEIFDFWMSNHQGPMDARGLKNTRSSLNKSLNRLDMLSHSAGISKSGKEKISKLSHIVAQHMFDIEGQIFLLEKRR